MNDNEDSLGHVLKKIKDKGIEIRDDRISRIKVSPLTKVTFVLLLRQLEFDSVGWSEEPEESGDLVVRLHPQ